jgi:hypothetical protein
MKIAICNDDIKIQFAIEGYVQHILEAYNIESEMECFDSGDNLCEHYEEGKSPYRISSAVWSGGHDLSADLSAGLSGGDVCRTRAGTSD